MSKWQDMLSMPGDSMSNAHAADLLPRKAPRLRHLRKVGAPAGPLVSINCCDARASRERLGQNILSRTPSARHPLPANL